MAIRVVLLAIWVAIASLGPLPAEAQGCTPGMRFVRDVTIPDDTPLAPGERFEKIWRLRNTGDCAWDTAWGLAFLGGQRMGGPRRIPLSATVDAEATLDVSVWMVAPDKPGSYTGYWQLQDPRGKAIGDRLYVRVLVRADQPTPNSSADGVDARAYLLELDALETDMIPVLGDLVTLVDEPKTDDKDWAVGVSRASVRLSGLDRRLRALRPPVSLKGMHQAMVDCVAHAYAANQELVRWIADEQDTHLDEALRLLKAANADAVRAKAQLDATTLPAPVPGATPDRRMAWRSFRSQNGFLTLRYPPGWRLEQQDGDAARFVSPDRGLMVAFGLAQVEADPLNSADLQTFAEAIADPAEDAVHETGVWPDAALTAGYADLTTTIDDRALRAIAIVADSTVHGLRSRPRDRRAGRRPHGRRPPDRVGAPSGDRYPRHCPPTVAPCVELHNFSPVSPFSLHTRLLTCEKGDSLHFVSPVRHTIMRTISVEGDALHNRIRRALTVLVTLSATCAVLVAPLAAAPPGQAPTPQRVIVQADDLPALKAVESAGGRVLVDYGAFALWEVPAAGVPSISALSAQASAGLTTIPLRGGQVIDTSGGRSASALPAAAAEPGLWLVQFIGPIKDEWLDQLDAAGLRIVQYTPNNAYVVWGDAAALTRLDKWNASAGVVQWTGPYRPEYRVAPALAPLAASGAAEPVDVTVQLDAVAAETTGHVAALQALAEAVIRPPSTVAGLTAVTVRLPAARVNEVAAWADVYNVEPYHPPVMLDEVQGQIVAGNVTSGPTVGPSAPGYLAWLATKGFPTTQNSYVDRRRRRRRHRSGQRIERVSTPTSTS